MRYPTPLLPMLFLLVASAAVAGSDVQEEDHEQVYHARQEARILPLETILERLELDRGTRLLEVEHEREHGIDIYEIEYLTRDGQVIEIEVDAATGRILKQEQE